MTLQQAQTQAHQLANAQQEAFVILRHTSGGWYRVTPLSSVTDDRSGVPNVMSAIDTVFPDTP